MSDYTDAETRFIKKLEECLDPSKELKITCTVICVLSIVIYAW